MERALKVEWKILVTAPDQLTAEMWQEILEQEGIPSMIQPQDVASYLGVSAMPCRLMVPKDLLAEAAATLASHLESRD
ncbi:MAG: DUF2007 domain-containing protein [Chloroflexi bacterium]|nr:DUF2007 domain-containing protein [Chloroflexota bacterium]